MCNDAFKIRLKEDWPEKDLHVVENFLEGSDGHVILSGTNYDSLTLYTTFGEFINGPTLTMKECLLFCFKYGLRIRFSPRSSFPIDLDKVVNQYLKTALWSDLNEDLWSEDFTVDDFCDDSRQCARKICLEFVDKNMNDLLTWDVSKGDLSEQIGHDLWLTHNHHGAGFWDGDWEESVGQRLTARCDHYGERYIDHDGDNLYFVG